MELAIILFSVGLVVLVVWMSARGKFSDGGSSAMSITAMHDMLPRDKQEAIEIMIEAKAGKKWEEQESGEGDGGEGKGQKEKGKEAEGRHTL
jgi:hypothetical protein